MRGIIVRIVVLVVLASSAAAHAERPTERYAPAQLQFAQEELELARDAAARGDAALAAQLAWQASLDARLTWQMTDSPALRADAVRIDSASSALVRRMTAAAPR